MVCPAQWDREFVADLEAETAGLREPQMMGIAGLAPADEARLFGHEPQVGFVALASASLPWATRAVSRRRNHPCAPTLPTRPTTGPEGSPRLPPIASVPLVRPHFCERPGKTARASAWPH